ncbi:MAG: SusD/RagB family nutrient-binding outer membrane lipoprotein [Bacteroidales bacterium]|nr:SusD/RagB family nutrient-binding outer membrane lipoprotein [Bacteroidales bacterium]
MKGINKILTGFTVLAVLLLVGCTKDFEDINSNPNQPTKANNTYLMTNAQFQLMDVYWDEWFNGRCGMLWSQYWAQNEYTEESRYRARPTTDDNYWMEYYRALNDLQEIIRTNKNADNPNTNEVQVARILKAYFFQVMTDTWGDIPYSEALQGNDNLQPKFDSQESIYTSLNQELKDAQSKLDPEATQDVKGDMIYGGKVNKWKKFANSLRLRIATRMKDKAPGKAQTIYDNIADGDVFQSNDDNATFVWGTAVPNNNPLNEDQKTRTDFSVSNTMVNTLKDYNDPRLSVYAAPINDESSDEYVGMTYGLRNSQAAAMSNDNVSQPGWEVYRPDAPTILMTYDEVLFIKEEWNNFDGSYYKDAVKNNLKFWGVPADERAAYLNTLPDAPTQDEVYTQKWIALYMQGLQGWSHIRRTNTPDLDPPAGGIYESVATYMTEKDVPTRRPYSQNIYDLNRANLDEALNRQGPDQINTQLWWDVQ